MLKSSDYTAALEEMNNEYYLTAYPPTPEPPPDFQKTEEAI